MNRPYKRGISVLLMVFLVAGLLSGLTCHAAQNGYVYNWGARGAVATELSSQAADFYAANDISYETLAVLPGAEELDDVSESPLYSALQALMEENHTHITTYSETKELYRYTDCQNSGGVISSFYSGASIGPDWDGTWNREHTWPNSKGLGGDDENDIMMLRPTCTSENSGRGNTAYGQSAGYYDPNSESGGVYDLRGDVARIALYTYTRWGNTGYMWNRYGVIESKEVLLSWMEADPVDTWELGRNDAVESITGTRNVYVDFPELAFLLFGEEIPAGMITPSGSATQSHAITITANDNTMGSSLLSGNVITAIPAEGYRVADCTVLSGSANITCSGNTFIVTPFSDCTVCVFFAPKEPATVSFLGGGAVLSQAETLTDDQILLPAYTGSLPAGYTFVGWSDSPVDSAKELPALYESGESYTVSGDTTFYAVVSYIATGSGDGQWTLVTDVSQLSAGDKIVLGAAKGEKHTVCGPMNGAYLSEVITTFSEDLSVIPSLPEDAQVFTLGGSKGAWTLANEDGKLLGATNVKKLAYDRGTTTWAISIAPNGALIENKTVSYGSFRYNVSAPRFTTYTSSVSATMLLPSIYRLDSSVGTTYYTTDFVTEIPGHMPGDINSDGKVNNKDASRLLQYLSGWDVEVNEAALDVSGDGKINNKDASRLFQYLSGWDVEIF